MVLQRRFFTIQRIPILRYGYRDRFPLIDILQIPVAQLDVYEPVWEINGITFFPAESEFAALMLTFAVFGSGFLMRPIGAIVLGVKDVKDWQRPKF